MRPILHQWWPHHRVTLILNTLNILNCIRLLVDPAPSTPALRALFAVLLGLSCGCIGWILATRQYGEMIDQLVETLERITETVNNLRQTL